MVSFDSPVPCASSGENSNVLESLQVTNNWPKSLMTLDAR